MIYEIKKSIEELERNNGKYKIVVIVGAIHTKNIKKFRNKKC